MLLLDVVVGCCCWMLLLMLLLDLVDVVVVVIVVVGVLGGCCCYFRPVSGVHQHTQPPPTGPPFLSTNSRKSPRTVSFKLPQLHWKLCDISNQHVNLVAS